MSFRTFLDEVRKGMPSLHYLLVSSDPFLLSEAVSLIRGLVPREQVDFNFFRFDLLNTDDGGPFAEILDVLNTMPFFSGRKVVVVENYQKIVKKDVQQLQHYIENPSESSVLVLLHKGAMKKDAKGSLKGVKQIGIDISEREIPAWLKSGAKSKGVEISDAATEYLIGAIGPDLGLLSSELDKCALIGKPKIEKHDIIEIIESKRGYNAFALIDAIRARNVEKVFSIYRVLRETEEPYSILGALNWQYGRFFAERDSPEARRYYFDVFRSLNEADTEIKSSGGAFPLELLLVRLLRLSKKRA